MEHRKEIWINMIENYIQDGICNIISLKKWNTQLKSKLLSSMNAWEHMGCMSTEKNIIN